MPLRSRLQGTGHLQRLRHAEMERRRLVPDPVRPWLPRLLRAEFLGQGRVLQAAVRQHHEQRRASSAARRLPAPPPARRAPGSHARRKRPRANRRRANEPARIRARPGARIRLRGIRVRRAVAASFAAVAAVGEGPLGAAAGRAFRRGRRDQRLRPPHVAAEGLMRASLFSTVNGYVFHIGLAIIVFGLAQHILFLHGLFGVSLAGHCPAGSSPASSVITLASLVAALGAAADQPGAEAALDLQRLFQLVRHRAPRSPPASSP